MVISLNTLPHVPSTESRSAAPRVEHTHTLTASLLALEAIAAPCISPLPDTSDFLPLQIWNRYLVSYPDQAFAEYLRRGITHGFRIGVNPTKSLRPAHGNLASVRAHPATVSEYIRRECANGKLARVSPERATQVRCNPIGLIPKPSQPGRFRLIVDLSAPRGDSVNDAINPEHCSLHYISVREAAKMVALCGPGTLLAKLDLKSAYRQVPVHPADQHLLGIQWQGDTFVDKALPFGLRSAPIIFTAVADGLAWAFQQEGIINVIHYLDDFLLWARAGEDLSTPLQLAIALCDQLGLPTAPEKVEGPSSVLTFLGIVIDTNRQELRLPQAKLYKLRQRLDWFSGRRNATRHQLESLVGLLNHAASVIPPGRLFTNHLLDVLKIRREPHQRVRLTSGCRADISWWTLLAPAWNGVSYLPGTAQPGLTVTSDASGTWGCGAFQQESPAEWFQLQWPPSWMNVNIAVKELLPIVASAALWGNRWYKKQVLFQSDNMATVQVLTSGTSRDPSMARLLRCLFFFEAYFGFEHVAVHVRGVDNAAADALSRNRDDMFLSLCPQAHPSPTQLPPSIVALLLDRELNWTSTRWASLFLSTLQEV